MNQTMTLRQAIRDCQQGDIRETSDGFVGDFCFPSRFIGFAGHFPGHPVLPAFIQLLTAQCVLQQRTGLAWCLARVKRAKFMKVVAPDQPLQVTWKEKESEDGIQGSFTLTVDEQKVASFTAAFVPEENGDA
jgi:3-hydroxyacyl-[acyl-carrier-protein] dehydratase